MGHSSVFRLDYIFSYISFFLKKQNSMVQRKLHEIAIENITIQSFIFIIR